jgi:hypothetical protein
MPNDPLLLAALASDAEFVGLVSPEPASSQKAGPNGSILTRLVRIRTSDHTDAGKTIEEAFGTPRSEPSVTASALRASIITNDKRWIDRARKHLRSDNEDLLAAALEYLAHFDNENFLLQTRSHVNSPSLIVRTALLRSLCRHNPENARELLDSMLNDKDIKVREKAIGSLIHFEFSTVRELIFNFLLKEKDFSLASACLPFYLTNPMLESTYDIHLLAERHHEKKAVFTQAFDTLSEALIEMNLADKEEIAAYIDRRTKTDALRQSEEDAREAERLTKLSAQIKWNSITESISELSGYYNAIKNVFLGGMFLFALFFFLAGSQEEEPITVSSGFNPVASQIMDCKLIVQKAGESDGSFIGLNENREKIMVLPRPGKAFTLKPGDSIHVRAMPFRKTPDNILIVKTIDIKFSP